MFALPLLLAAGSITLTNGAPVSAPLSNLADRAASSHSLNSRDASDPFPYIEVFSGTGAISQGWPAVNQWIPSFDQMYSNNNDILKSSCQGFDASLENNSDDEIANMKTAITNVASKSGVDPRYIFAIIMQESNGCVRVDTTNGGVRNPGLMQSHNGAGSCNDNGEVQSPCPLAEITQMIEDGTNGVSGAAGGPGLATLLSQTGVSDDSKYYIAARMYNSGSVAPGGNLGAGGATHCYSTDVANRLVGWASDASLCMPSLIGTLNGLDSLFGGISFSDPTSSQGGQFIQQPSTPTPTPTPTPAAPVVPAATTTTSAAPTTTPAAPVSTPAVVVPDPSSQRGQDSNSGNGSTITPGTACSTEGEWNCIANDSFQQCASGLWSAVQQVAGGTVCKAGTSAAIQITDATSRKRHLAHLAQAHGLRHAARKASL